MDNNTILLLLLSILIVANKCHANNKSEQKQLLTIFDVLPNNVKHSELSVENFDYITEDINPKTIATTKKKSKQNTTKRPKQEPADETEVTHSDSGTDPIILVAVFVVVVIVVFAIGFGIFFFIRKTSKSKEDGNANISLNSLDRKKRKPAAKISSTASHESNMSSIVTIDSESGLPVRKHVPHVAHHSSDKQKKVNKQIIVRKITPKHHK